MTRLRKKLGKAPPQRAHVPAPRVSLITPPPAIDDDIRHRQLEILNHFGTIDFDPDYDPLEMRRRDRERLKREIESRDF